MEHTVSKLHNGRVILADIGATLSIDEWADVSQEILEALQDIAPQPGYIIVDMSKTQKHPINAIAIKKVTVWAAAQNFASVTHVVNNRYTAILGDVVIALFAKNYQAVDTLAEAFERVKQADPTIGKL